MQSRGPFRDREIHAIPIVIRRARGNRLPHLWILNAAQVVELAAHDGLFPPQLLFVFGVLPGAAAA